MSEFKKYFEEIEMAKVNGLEKTNEATIIAIELKEYLDSLKNDLICLGQDIRKATASPKKAIMLKRGYDALYKRKDMFKYDEYLLSTNGALVIGIKKVKNSNYVDKEGFKDTIKSLLEGVDIAISGQVKMLEQLSHLQNITPRMKVLVANIMDDLEHFATQLTNLAIAIDGIYSPQQEGGIINNHTTNNITNELNITNSTIKTVQQGNIITSHNTSYEQVINYINDELPPKLVMQLKDELQLLEQTDNPQNLIEKLKSIGKKTNEYAPLISMVLTFIFTVYSL